ncbi:MAG: hypothetical protein DRJ03_02065 [Chloroflexi bacterium]|nr:MAG: hypothetical protein DRJ03_02065 [Chloroflexota bacterium]
MEAIYTHDCDRCEFVQNLTVEGIKYDVYRCPSVTGADATWLARYSDELDNYWSMPWGILKTVDLGVESTTSLLRAVHAIAQAAEDSQHMEAANIAKAIEVVNEQAEDETLWVRPETIVEAYTQRALRRLHAVLEGDKLTLAKLEEKDDRA